MHSPRVLRVLRVLPSSLQRVFSLALIDLCHPTSPHGAPHRGAHNGFFRFGLRSLVGPVQKRVQKRVVVRVLRVLRVLRVQTSSPVNVAKTHLQRR
jgi:hypothetical protein